MVAALKEGASVLHASQVHLFRKAAPQIHQQNNVPPEAIEQVGWTAKKCMNKHYDKEPPATYLVGAAGCAPLRRYPRICIPMFRTWCRESNPFGA